MGIVKSNWYLFYLKIGKLFFLCLHLLLTIKWELPHFPEFQKPELFCVLWWFSFDLIFLKIKFASCLKDYGGLSPFMCTLGSHSYKYIFMWHIDKHTDKIIILWSQDLEKSTNLLGTRRLDFGDMGSNCSQYFFKTSHAHSGLFISFSWNVIAAVFPR